MANLYRTLNHGDELAQLGMLQYLQMEPSQRSGRRPCAWRVVEWGPTPPSGLHRLVWKVRRGPLHLDVSARGLQWAVVRVRDGLPLTRPCHWAKRRWAMPSGLVLDWRS